MRARRSFTWLPHISEWHRHKNADRSLVVIVVLYITVIQSNDLYQVNGSQLSTLLSRGQLAPLAPTAVVHPVLQGKDALSCRLSMISTFTS